MKFAVYIVVFTSHVPMFLFFYTFMFHHHLSLSSGAPLRNSQPWILLLGFKNRWSNAVILYIATSHEFQIASHPYLD
jgi:hypothetical protein